MWKPVIGDRMVQGSEDHLENSAALRWLCPHERIDGGTQPRHIDFGPSLLKRIHHFEQRSRLNGGCGELNSNLVSVAARERLRRCGLVEKLPERLKFASPHEPECRALEWDDVANAGVAA